MINSYEQKIAWLRNPKTIKSQCQKIYQRTLEGNSDYFSVNLDKMQTCQDILIRMIKSYPDFDAIPFHSRWRHFEVCDIDRVGQFRQEKNFSNPLEEGRVLYELAILSVLLDAGAGASWQYTEASTGLIHNRSEGLAIASWDMFKTGLFSEGDDLAVSAKKLKALTLNDMALGFQINESNPMTGLEGRFELLHSLANTLLDNSAVFKEEGRLGYFYDYVIGFAKKDKTIKAKDVFQAVLHCFSPIWPGRLSLDNCNLGDVWSYEALKDDNDAVSHLIPFHKLSLWLTYSLLEPLMWHGYHILELDELTGLAEYRNGGFFIDSGVIGLKNDKDLTQPHLAESDLIIEWRALTLSLLDVLWLSILEALDLSKTDFPLVKMLEAGSWKAGRELAYQKRSDGAPPLNIISNGTIF